METAVCRPSRRRSAAATLKVCLHELAARSRVRRLAPELLGAACLWQQPHAHRPRDGGSKVNAPGHQHTAARRSKAAQRYFATASPTVERFAHLGQILVLIVDALNAFATMADHHLRHLVDHTQRRQPRAHGAPQIVNHERLQAGHCADRRHAVAPALSDCAACGHRAATWLC